MDSVLQADRPVASVGRHELDVLTQGCGFYQPKLAVISVAGRDRVRWLNGMISNNVRDLAPGHGIYAFVLNAQGQIQGELYVFSLGETMLITMEEQQKDTLLPLLRRYIIMDKVELQEVTEQFTVFALLGPKSEQVLADSGLKTASLDPLSVVESSWKDSAIILIRGDNPCVPSFWLMVPRGSTEAFLNTIRHSGAEEVNSETVEAFRIVCGTPKMRVDIREKTLPQETGQERALNFNKGCYIGQEIVERVRARGSVHRTFIGIKFVGLESVSGTKIQSDGKDVGEITSVARIAADDGARIIGLGYLRKEFLSPEKELTAGGCKIKVSPLPFTEFLKSA